MTQQCNPGAVPYVFPSLSCSQGPRPGQCEANDRGLRRNQNVVCLDSRGTWESLNFLYRPLRSRVPFAEYAEFGVSEGPVFDENRMKCRARGPASEQ